MNMYINKYISHSLQCNNMVCVVHPSYFTNQENGVHLLRVHGKDPCKYVLSLIDVLFSKEEWQNVAI